MIEDDDLWRYAGADEHCDLSNGPLRDLRRSRWPNDQLEDGRIYSEITGLADNEDPRDVEIHFYPSKLMH